jgi:hypothetical protein
MAGYDLDYGYGGEFRGSGSRRPGSWFRGSERSGPQGSRRRYGGAGMWRDYGGEFRRDRSIERGYGGEFRGSHGGEGGYGREYRKSRWQSEYGDPFRDRERNTPVRMMPGEWDEYGREMLRYGSEYGRGPREFGGESRGWRGRRSGPEHGGGRSYRGSGAGGEFLGWGGGYGREYRSRRWRY